MQCAREVQVQHACISATQLEHACISATQLDGVYHQRAFSIAPAVKGSRWCTRSCVCCVSVHVYVQVIADSNVIIARLATLFEVEAAEHRASTPEQRAIAHAATRMVEEHLAQVGFYYRYGLHMPEFYDALSVRSARPAHIRLDLSMCMRVPRAEFKDARQ